MEGNRILIVHDGKILGIEEPETPVDVFKYHGEARACPEAMAAAAPWLYDAAKAAMARYESMKWGNGHNTGLTGAEHAALKAAVSMADGSPLPSAERR